MFFLLSNTSRYRVGISRRVLCKQLFIACSQKLRIFFFFTNEPVNDNLFFVILNYCSVWGDLCLDLNACIDTL